MSSQEQIAVFPEGLKLSLPSARRAGAGVSAQGLEEMHRGPGGQPFSPAGMCEAQAHPGSSLQVPNSHSSSERSTLIHLPNILKGLERRKLLKATRPS